MVSGNAETPVVAPPKKKRKKVDYEQVELDSVILAAIRENDLTWFLRGFSLQQVRDSLGASFFMKGKIPRLVWGSICQHEFHWIKNTKMRPQSIVTSLCDQQWDDLKKAILELHPQQKAACNGIAQAERLIRTKISTNLKQLMGLPKSYKFWER